MAQEFASTSIPYHVPVLCRESIAQLVTRPDGFYIDATMGGGGHTRALLAQLSPRGHLFAFDRDADARAQAPRDPRLTFVAADFRYLAHWMEYYNVSAIDGVLADLGVSSHHLDAGERGFSYRYTGAVPDMRMNQRGGLSAGELLAQAPEEELARIFYYYGDLKDSRRLAALIVQARRKGIPTIGALIEVLEPLLPKGDTQRRSKLSRLFQALRIEVNGEAEALQELLRAASGLLAPGGRLAFISYHSLEDRIIKEFFRSPDAPKCPLKVLTKKPILPSAEEVNRNARARSAKLRVAERPNPEAATR